MFNESGCGSFFNFQEYTSVHTVVEVYTATGIEQYCVAMQEGDGWLMMYELDAPVYCDSFGDVVDAAWSAMVDHLGVDAVDAIENDWRDYGVCPAAAASLAA
jgi:hypothetical protein